jgi:23S rRNA (guanosine2251-2'-O)-methyltransferase
VPHQPSPRDRFITLYGRRPVLEALADETILVDKVVLADNMSAAAVREIVHVANGRGVEVRRASAERVKLLAGNGRQDQGVIADVTATNMTTVEEYLERSAGGTGGEVVLLDGITTPANVGMILRSATASGIDGVVVPYRGVASLDPMVVKASAGTAFRAPVIRARTAAAAASVLAGAGRPLVGLAVGSGSNLFEAQLPDRGVYVLGSESDGVSGDVAAHITTWVFIPMQRGVESLNVASAAAVLCFELMRRRALRGAAPAGPALR